METQSDVQTPPPQSVQPSHKHWSTILIVAILIVFLGTAAYVVLSTKATMKKPTQVVVQDPSPTATTNEIANWKTYNSSSLGISFKYPPTYPEPQESKNYISLISPLNSDNVKGSGLQNGELKIEIYFENANQNLSLEAYVREKNETGAEILEQSETTLDGVRTIHQKLKGYGTSEAYYILHGGKKLMIVKYPLETTRQDEFEKILSSFRFLDKTITNQISPQEKQQIDAWTKANNRNAYGDPQGTVYAGGTPLFNEMSGESKDKYEYILEKHPDRPWKTSDWKIYKNNELGISIKYPKTWETTSQFAYSSGITHEVIGFDHTDKQQRKSFVRLRYFDNPKNLSPQEFEKDYVSRPSHGPAAINSPGVYSDKAEAVKIGNITAYHIQDGFCHPIICDTYTWTYKNKLFKLISDWNFNSKNSDSKKEKEIFDTMFQTITLY